MVFLDETDGFSILSAAFVTLHTARFSISTSHIGLLCFAALLALLSVPGPSPLVLLTRLSRPYGHATLLHAPAPNYLIT